jgi:diguanylate cyclase (GGDEF)-like protein
VRFFTQKRLWRTVPLIAATIFVGVGAYFVGFSAIHNMQRSQAEHVARSFGSYLLGEVPDLADLIEGKRSPQVASAIIGAVQPIGTVLRFRIYDQNGTLRGDSDFFREGLTIGAGVHGRSAKAAAVIATGHPSFRINEGSGPSGPRYSSDITIPLVDKGRTVGVLSVVSDETETWPALFDQFRSVLLQVGLLIVVAFGIPLLMYLQKNGQLAKAAMRLRQSTQYDELTGCLNRATFTRIVQDLVDSAGERGLSVAVHFIDLDRFKDVNESLGHDAGDAVLKAAAERLRRLMGTRERIARLGADEFAICQPYYVNSPQVVIELANDVVRALGKPFEVGDRKVQIGASGGFACHPRDGKTVAELMRAADIAIHQAKEKSRGKAVAFDPSMETERQRRQAIEARMREALVENGFDIHFQPLFETATGRLRGFEALLRLSGHDGHPISPAEFVPIAEEVGLIFDLGTWVMRESCRMAKQWPDDLVVSVNLSPAQFVGGAMEHQVRDVLAWSGLPPARLELEVTESVLITDTENVLSELRSIKALGVSVALDDFGTGYSSLGYLWRFPFDKLKVDKSFMTDLAVAGSKSREILSTIIALGKVLDLKVTAEGVETEAQAEVLRELKCDLVQGYLYGRPMRATEVAAVLMRELVPARSGRVASPEVPLATGTMG